MGMLSAIGKGLGAIFGIGGGQTSVATEVADIVERWAPSQKAKHQMAMDIDNLFVQSQASAREHDQPQNSGVPILDALVNGVNRLIRPGITVGLLGGIVGWWPLPDPGSVDPMFWRYGEIIIAFWFGSRTLFKDLPAAIKYLRKTRAVAAPVAQEIIQREKRKTSQTEIEDLSAE